MSRAITRRYDHLNLLAAYMSQINQCGLAWYDFQDHFLNFRVRTLGREPAEELFK